MKSEIFPLFDVHILYVLDPCHTVWRLLYITHTNNNNTDINFTLQHIYLYITCENCALMFVILVMERPPHWVMFFQRKNLFIIYSHMTFKLSLVISHEILCRGEANPFWKIPLSIIFLFHLIFYKKKTFVAPASIFTNLGNAT